MGSKIAIAILILITVASVFAPLLTNYDPVRIDLDSIKEPPGLSHPFGTDNKGRDILSRILYGGRLSIGIAVTAGVISLCLGLTVGLIAGYFGGRVDMALMMLVDLILSFPSLLLAIGISVVFPPGVFTVVIAITAVGWASFARLIRGNVLSLREFTYIDSARALGCSDARIIVRHILPNCLPFSFIVLGLKLGGYLLTESALSFLGLGAQPPAPTWGSMISINRIYILSAPWMVIFAGLAIFATAVCFNILGDMLRNKMDFKFEI
ncbi:MAG: ABC transporter permease [Nitrospirae bacterium]|nr:ABC transporter permease [Nitrospirota bacterium]